MRVLRRAQLDDLMSTVRTDRSPGPPRDGMAIKSMFLGSVGPKKVEIWC